MRMFVSIANSAAHPGFSDIIFYVHYCIPIYIREGGFSKKIDLALFGLVSIMRSNNIIILLYRYSTHVVFVVSHAVHPETHGHAYEHCPRGDQADSYIPDSRHRFRVMIGQPEPVEQGTDAHQRHAKPVRPLRFFRHDQRHFRVCDGLGDVGDGRLLSSCQSFPVNYNNILIFIFRRLSHQRHLLLRLRLLKQ